MYKAAVVVCFGEVGVDGDGLCVVVDGASEVACLVEQQCSVVETRTIAEWMVR